MSAHLAAVQLDSVMDREEVAHHIVDSVVAIHKSAWAGIAGVRNWKVMRIKDGVQRMIWQERYPEAHK